MMNGGGVESKPPKGFPDFLGSVNLKYLKLGYIYLLSLSNTFCFFLPPLLLLFIFVSRFLPLLVYPLSIFLLLLLYHFLTPSSVFLLDFSCYRPPDHFKVTSLPFTTFLILSLSLLPSHCFVFFTDHEKRLHRAGNEVWQLQRDFHRAPKKSFGAIRHRRGELHAESGLQAWPQTQPP